LSVLHLNNIFISVQQNLVIIELQFKRLVYDLMVELLQQGHLPPFGLLNKNIKQLSDNVMLPLPLI